MSNAGLLCWGCGKPTGITGRVMRTDSCVDCLADLRSCRGCRFFDPTRNKQCKERIATTVTNKEKNNMCDFFQKRDADKIAGGVSHQRNPKVDKKKNFDDLFKD